MFRFRNGRSPDQTQNAHRGAVRRKSSEGLDAQQLHDRVDDLVFCGAGIPDHAQSIDGCRGILEVCRLKWPNGGAGGTGGAQAESSARELLLMKDEVAALPAVV